MLRADSRRLYFVCHRSKQYSQLAYPVKYEKLNKGPGLGPPPEDFLAFQLLAPGTTGKSQIANWPVDTFDATVVNGYRNQFRLHVAVADLGAIEAPILEFRKLLNELEYSGHGWSKFLPFAHGVPIVWEEGQHQPQTEFLYREEVTNIQDRSVPANTYDVPDGYREVKFDRSCVQFR